MKKITIEMPDYMFDYFQQKADKAGLNIEGKPTTAAEEMEQILWLAYHKETDQEEKEVDLPW